MPEPVHELHLPQHGVAVRAVLVHLQHQHPPRRLVHDLEVSIYLARLIGAANIGYWDSVTV